MKTIISNQVLDQERALYGAADLEVAGCRFEGPADGESALKECDRILVRDSWFDLRYPFWHDRGLELRNSTLTEQCRAALWYSHDVRITDCVLGGIKALRECRRVTLERCQVTSAEFGWFSRGVAMAEISAGGEYFMMGSRDLTLRDVRLKGKYSFQYVENAELENCGLDTKDAFWHAKNVVVRNSTVKGEYLAWYSENVTFENCRIIGTQPLCYCKGLKLINCRMEETDLAFERSQVEATVTTEIVSIKNPYAGFIEAPGAGEIILDDPEARCVLRIQGSGKNR